MFTIFGATGHTGSVTAERLLERGHQVRAVVRSKEKGERLAERGAELAIGDLDDAAFVAAALKGVEGAYLVAPPDLQSGDLLAKNARIVDHYVAGLDAARVPHAVFLSSVGAQHPEGTGPTRFSHYGEIALQKCSHTALTFLRAPFFMENLLGHAELVKRDGILPVFGGGAERPLPMIATRDVGEAAASALLAAPKEHGWVELEGPRRYSFDEAATIASALLGRPVRTVSLPIEQMVPMLVSGGVSPSVAELFRELNVAMSRGLLSYEGKGPAITGATDLKRVLAVLGTERSSTEFSKSVVRRVFLEAVNEGRMELLPELFAEDYLGPQGDRGPAAFGATMAGLKSAFPDLRYVVEDLLAEGDRVAMRWTWTGTHRGAFRTYPPTNRAITNTGMAILQLRDGRIARIWMETDRLGFQQLMQAQP